MSVFKSTLLLALGEQARDMDRVYVRAGIAYATDGHRMHMTQTELTDGTYMPDGAPALGRVEPWRLLTPENLQQVDIDASALLRELEMARYVWPSSHLNFTWRPWCGQVEIAPALSKTKRQHIETARREPSDFAATLQLRTTLPIPVALNLGYTIDALRHTLAPVLSYNADAHMVRFGAAAWVMGVRL